MMFKKEPVAIMTLTLVQSGLIGQTIETVAPVVGLTTNNALVLIYKENGLTEDVPMHLAMPLLAGEQNKTVELIPGQIIINAQAIGPKGRNILKDVPMMLAMILING